MFTPRMIRLQFSGKRLYSFVALPSWQELKVFLDFAGPIAFALLGKVFSDGNYSRLLFTCCYCIVHGWLRVDNGSIWNWLKVAVALERALLLH